MHVMRATWTRSQHSRPFWLWHWLVRHITSHHITSHHITSHHITQAPARPTVSPHRHCSPSSTHCSASQATTAPCPALLPPVCGVLDMSIVMVSGHNQARRAALRWCSVDVLWCLKAGTCSPRHPLNVPTYANHITSHHITSHHITSHHITSHHITSHHITSITSLTSHHIISPLQLLGVISETAQSTQDTSTRIKDAQTTLAKHWSKLMPTGTSYGHTP